MSCVCGAQGKTQKKEPFCLSTVFNQKLQKMLWHDWALNCLQAVPFCIQYRSSSGRKVLQRLLGMLNVNPNCMEDWFLCVDTEKCSLYLIMRYFLLISAAWCNYHVRAQLLLQTMRTQFCRILLAADRKCFACNTHVWVSNIVEKKEREEKATLQPNWFTLEWIGFCMQWLNFETHWH